MILSPDSPEMSVSAVNNASGVILFEGVSFKHATAFKPVDAASTSFEIKNANGVKVLSAAGISLQPGRFHTIITRGFSNPPAGNSNVLSMEVL
jgi:hypothetical protein